MLTVNDVLEALKPVTDPEIGSTSSSWDWSTASRSRTRERRCRST